MSLQINLLNWLKSKFNTKEEITSYLNNKVDKVSGKSLVADTEITRLGGMETGANKITAGTGLTKSGTALGISTGGVTSTQIAEKTIVNGDIADTTIQGGKLVSGTITATQLASNSVTTAKITNANVTTDKLADGAVTTGKIADGQVNNAKLANNAVTSAKIADGTIVNGDIASGTINHLKMEKSSIAWAPAGYAKILRIKVNTTWANTPICFELHKRSLNQPINCSLMFYGAETTDPVLYDYNFLVDAPIKIYAYKTTTSTWEIIVPTINNDWVTIKNLRVGDYAYQSIGDYFTFTYLTDTNVSLPSDTTTNPVIQATPIIADDLTTDSSTRCLSAKQGKTLKTLVDGKSPNDHNHDSTYLKIANGVFSGSLTDTTGIENCLPAKRSFVGSFTDGTNWWSVISARHRNGASDGIYYGMYLRSKFGSNDLVWCNNYKGSVSGLWTTEKTILDSSNYSTYASPKTHVHGSIANDGKLNSDASAVNKIVVTDSNNYIKTVSTIGTAKIADGAVTNAKIGDSQVNNAKLANNAVTSAKIADGTIVNDDIAYNTISHRKMEKSTIWWSSTGYTKVLRINVNSGWADVPISFEIQKRGMIQPIRCSLKFDGGSSLDPNLTAGNFIVDAPITLYAYKVATSAWDIIVPTGNNDVTTIRNLSVGDYAYQSGVDFFEFTYLTDKNTTLPTGTTTNPLIASIRIDSIPQLAFRTGSTIGSGAVSTPHSMTHSKNGYIYMSCTDQKGIPMNGKLVIDWNNGGGIYERTLSNGMASLQVTATGTYNIKVGYHENGIFKAYMMGRTTVS